MLYALHDCYINADPEAKPFYETTIGAAIFYLPQSKALHYTGMISEAAVETGSHCKEHLFPRKIRAEALLTEPPETVEELVDVCNRLYLRYNITTSAENTRLKQYQRADTFTDPESAYKLAAITLIPDTSLSS